MFGTVSRKFTQEISSDVLGDVKIIPRNKGLAMHNPALNHLLYLTMYSHVHPSYATFVSGWAIIIFDQQRAL